MFNHTLFEIASADEYRRGAGSTALLALRRFCWRSLKQIGQVSAGLLSLFLIVSMANHGAAFAEMSSAEATPAKTISVPHRQSSQSSQPSLNLTASPTVSPTASPNSSALNDSSAIVSSARGKPFQVLRPKMTYHRFTTSRFSIPPRNSQAIINLSGSE